MAPTGQGNPLSDRLGDVFHHGLFVDEAHFDPFYNLIELLPGDGAGCWWCCC